MVSMPADDLAGADIHDDGADHAEQQAGGEAHHRGRGQSSHDIIEQTLHAARKDSSSRSSA